MKSKEHVLLRQILAKDGASNHHRLWRNETGVYHAGHIVFRNTGPRAVERWIKPGQVIMERESRVTAGLCPGSSDLVGILSVPVRLLDPDSEIGIFMGLEGKASTTTVQENQERWMEVIRQLGGIADVVRSPEDVHRIVTRYQGNGK